MTAGSEILELTFNAYSRRAGEPVSRPTATYVLSSRELANLLAAQLTDQQLVDLMLTCRERFGTKVVVEVGRQATVAELRSADARVDSSRWNGSVSDFSLRSETASGPLRPTDLDAELRIGGGVR